MTYTLGGGRESRKTYKVSPETFLKVVYVDFSRERKLSKKSSKDYKGSRSRRGGRLAK